MRYTVETEILAQLQSKSRAELQVLLERLIRQQPDIQPLVATLLKLPATGSASVASPSGAGRACTLDPATISSQVTAAFSRAGRGWGAASHAAMELDRLSEIGDHFTEAGQWANAQAVYATIAEDILPSYEELEDEDQIAGVLDNCSAGLIACLEAQETLSSEDRLDEVQRKALLTSLFCSVDLQRQLRERGERSFGGVCSLYDRQRTRTDRAVGAARHTGGRAFAAGPSLARGALQL